VFSVQVPLDDLRIRTLTDIIPGILTMERETQEMLGVVIEDIPDSRPIFTPRNLPADMKPMRNSSLSGSDKTGGTADESL
jgi:Ni,Fe-hydrogenase III component G